MYESIAKLKRLLRSAWSATFAIALSLTAIAVLSACGDETKPAATPEPASTLTPASANTSTPTSTPTIVPAVPTVSEELRSERERAAPAATDAELAELVDGNNVFAFDLYHALRETSGGNLFYSPYSISLALAMTYAGASSETERQMADTLSFLLPQDRLHPAFNALDIELASRGGGAESDDDEGFRLNIANAVWGQKGYEFLEPFLDVLAENYGAGVRPADFVGSPEESRIGINDWVADRTEDRIKDLIPKNAITPLTRLALTNAIYFNARWFYPFAKNRTSVRPFHLLDGGEVEAPMMMTAEAEWLGYASGEGYQAVELPYKGPDMSITILLPDEGTFREFEEAIDADLIARIFGDIERKNVELTMPKFEFESGFGLRETLKTMGMPNAFDEKSSDFSGMDGRSCLAGDRPCLLISGAFHKAFVAVDEEGTEAAAATGVVLRQESLRPEPIAVVVDRPFIFLIHDGGTDSILFVGRVEDPGE